VRDVEPLEPEHARATPGEMMERGAPHPAESDDDDVESVGATHDEW
jgi:hypothetical protein